MPKEFRKVEKECKFCGGNLQLNNTRDIQRKNFCSRKCVAKFLWKKGIYHGMHLTQKTKEKMRQSKINLLKTGWKPLGWKKYITEPRISHRGYRFLGAKREHQLIMENYLKRKLLRGEVIHHIDSNKLNNQLDNLKLMNRSEHMKLHISLRRIEYGTASI